MGEYWKPVNLDKKQQVHPHHVGDGLKFGEWVIPSHSNTRRRVEQLVATGVWDEDDEVRIVSDYGGSEHWLGRETDRPADYHDDWEDAPDPPSTLRRGAPGTWVDDQGNVLHEHKIVMTGQLLNHAGERIERVYGRLEKDEHGTVWFRPDDGRNIPPMQWIALDSDGRPYMDLVLPDEVPD